MEQDVFESWLDEEMKRVMKNIKKNEPLTQYDKLAILIKGLSNHITHLDIEIKEGIKLAREESESRFNLVKEEISNLRKDTKEEINNLRKDTKEEFNNLRQDFNNQRNDTKEELKYLRIDMDNRFAKVTDEMKKLYTTVNTQTWRMIGTVGLIVILGKLIESFGG